MSEEKLAELKRLLEAARQEYTVLGTGDKAMKALGLFVFEEAYWGTLMIKDRTSGRVVEVEV